MNSDTLTKAAMEAETLLTNYLVAGKFPQGSDCEEVRNLLRVALRVRRLRQK